MTGLFKVTYMDPKRGASNMEAYRVIAANATDAIKKADKHKTYGYYVAEEVVCLGWQD